MANKPPYTTDKRSQKRLPAKGVKPSRNVVFVCNEVLKEVNFGINEQKLAGVATFVTESGKEIRRNLIYTWLPQGIWNIKFEKDPNTSGILARPMTAQNVDQVLVDRVNQLYAGKKITLYEVAMAGKGPDDPMLECLHRSAIGKTIPFYVTYYVSAGGKKGQGIPNTPLTDDYLVNLQNERVAKLFIVMLEHFAGINVDERIALGGISRQEYQAIVKIGSKDSDLTAQTIARVITQAAGEFAGYKQDFSWQGLTLMSETILYQRKRKNPLAVNNQLEIARGIIRAPGGALAEDIGIKKRGDSSVLLYDKFGNAIPAYIGYMDLNYRIVDLTSVSKIAIIDGQSPEGQMIQMLNQVFNFPAIETAQLVAAMISFYKFISEEVCRLYGGEIQKKVMAMLPMAIGFFIAHAVLGVFARRGNVVAAALLAGFKAMGWILGIDMGIVTIKNMMIAGQHYAKMEMIHRRSPKEKGKDKLSQLSLYHLEVGTHYLIQAISELAAMGIFIAGGVVGSKLAGKFMLKPRGEAKLEFKVQADKITEVRAIKETTKIEIETQTVKVEPPAAAAAGKGGKLKLVKEVDAAPLEEAGQNLGRREKAQIPTQKVTAIRDLNVKSWKEVTNAETYGMPKEHLEKALAAANETGTIGVMRGSKSVCAELIKKGHPPKPKELIELNTDQTGQVRANTPVKVEIARKAGYEVENGYVIDPKTKKTLTSDYDLQDVIIPTAPGRNMAAVPLGEGGKVNIKANVTNPTVSKFTNALNKLLDMPRIVHGADAQFMQYKYFRSEAFKGEPFLVIFPEGVLPAGSPRVFILTQAELRAFYTTIGRSRLEIPLGLPTE
jgi:hypothetical protein